MSLSRGHLFELLRAISIPETQGCWGTATGNFDGQIISVGVLQWNYGQRTLPALMRLFRRKYASAAEFQQVLGTLMPTHGELVFPLGCTSDEINPACRAALLALQSGNALDRVLIAELEALFNSDAMIQIQVDHFLTILTRLSHRLSQIFPGRRPSRLEIKWALDMAIQQGSFPAGNHIRVMRQRGSRLNQNQRRDALLSIIRWYDGLCGSVDQDGCRLDREYNVRVWTDRINTGFDDIQFDLMNLTFLRSRTATGGGGRFQANAFQRRATIIFGTGSLAGRRIGEQ